MLLATDLDGTFLGGNYTHKQQLYNIINSTPYVQLIFVTGRGLNSVLPLFTEELPVPKPSFIICDVGATVINATTFEPVEPIQSLIEEKWPGREKILESLGAVAGLQTQNVPQERRCSFFFDDTTDINDLKNRVSQLNCDLIFSAGRFADVLPKGVNKGHSLRSLAKQFNFPADKILVAGDTFNDLSLFNAGYKGVVVGNAEAGLLEATVGKENIYQAKAEGAGGILEAIEYFPAFKKELNK